MSVVHFTFCTCKKESKNLWFVSIENLPYRKIFSQLDIMQTIPFIEPSNMCPTHRLELDHMDLQFPVPLSLSVLPQPIENCSKIKIKDSIHKRREIRLDQWLGKDEWRRMEKSLVEILSNDISNKIIFVN